MGNFTSFSINQFKIDYFVKNFHFEIDFIQVKAEI